MKAEKAYDPHAGGVPLDANFVEHCRICERCQQFDPSKPATASLMCLEGAVLYKRDNVTRPRVARQERPESFATKAQVKALMRYRGEQ